MSSIPVVLILKKKNEDERFFLQLAFPSTFATFREKISLKIRDDLPPGCTFTLKYKNKVSDLTFKLCDDEDVERMLLEPSSFEILVFPTRTPVNFATAAEQSIYDILLSIFTFNLFIVKTNLHVESLSDIVRLPSPGILIWFKSLIECRYIFIAASLIISNWLCSYNCRWHHFFIR
ncbi:hypothetical protein HK096_007128 [Nowakowskiella sp. JEL0078]|nr:hypothetical protein HK096_007128 [Nowakowskiella sp. JEL0078]